MMSKPVSVSIVVPVYNSEETLTELATRIEKVFTELDISWETILVNDGSSDGSWSVIQQLTAEKKYVRGLNLMRNYGQHNALLAGIRHAKGELTVTLDDDLQNPPEEIPKLINAMNEDVDVIYGEPIQKQHGIVRNAASVMSKLVLSSVLGYKHAGSTSPFRLFRTNLRDSFANFSASNISIDVLLTWSTNRFGHLPVEHIERPVGTSNYTLKKLTLHALNIITSFSILPLRIATMVGFACVIFGIIILGYILVGYAVYDSPLPGFTFLASIITIFSGVQLFTLGIIGEYIGRIHLKTLEQPAYVIKETLDKC